MKDPFFAGTYSGHKTYHLDVQSRLTCVQKMSRAELLAASQMKGLQKTVSNAIARRLRLMGAGEGKC